MARKITVFCIFLTGFSTQAQQQTKNEKLRQNAFQQLDIITITGTKTEKKRTQNPIVVNVIDAQKMEEVGACTLSDGLRFQTGLRVEVNCQTCNYTQLRMNGLAGGYSQVLIDSRPIFSPLTGLYGLEQIPKNMIDKIEVVKGGGSVLYGSSAIGGTVNILTKIPKKNQFEINYTLQNTKGAFDNILNATGAVVSKNRKMGASFFASTRKREAFDINSDNFSELPFLKNTSFGTHLFFIPADNQKLNVSFSKLNTYRLGGEMEQKAAYLLAQSEERLGDIYTLSADYKLDFNDYESSLIAYLGVQANDRTHFTGIIPDDKNEYQAYTKNPPYGDSKTRTYQTGLQLNHHFENFAIGEATITVGAEYLQDYVLDRIASYNYKIDQRTKNTAVFLQHDWTISDKLSFLSGIRWDRHNLVDRNIFNPRFALLYKPFENGQLRASFATGFRAPQSFDSDLHISFAGGGVSRITLADDLKEERSKSYSVSFNYDRPTEHYIYGVTVEGFHTRLHNAFYQQNIGSDANGELFEKRNGGDAVVQGLTLEARANYDQIVQLETGFTFQTSLFDVAVENAPTLEKRRNFLRTPNHYGYATLTLQASKKWNASLNYLYTGTMEILHLAGAPEQQKDAYFISPTFSELGVRVSYLVDTEKMGFKTKLSTGVKNIFDAYQNDFDTGKNRDSNYVYGPAMPRTFTFEATISF